MNKIILILLLFTKIAFSQNEEINDYIERNQEKIDVHNIEDLSDFSFLDNEIIQKRLFINSEISFKRCNYPMKLKLSRYLYEKANVRYFFIRHSPGIAYFIQKYIDTKNDSVFSKFTLSYQYAYNFEYYPYLTRVFTNDEDKISMIGTNVIFDKELELDALIDILELNNNLNNDLIDLKNYLVQIIKNSTIEDNYQNVKLKLKRIKDLNCLKNYGKHFYRISYSIIQDNEIPFKDIGCKHISKVMLNNIKHFMKLNKDANCFLSLPYSQTVNNTCDLKNEFPFLSLIKNDETLTFNDSILSMMFYYAYKNNDIIINKDLKKILNKRFKENNEFFVSTKNYNSPFSDNLELIDYLIILNGRSNKLYPIK